MLAVFIMEESYFLYEVCNFHRVLVSLTERFEELSSVAVFAAFYICSGEFLTNYFVFCMSMND